MQTARTTKLFAVTTESGVEMGTASAKTARDAVRKALKREGHTVYSHPHKADTLICRDNAPVYIACDYQVGEPRPFGAPDTETVRMMSVSETDL